MLTFLFLKKINHNLNLKMCLIKRIFVSTWWSVRFHLLNKNSVSNMTCAKNGRLAAMQNAVKLHRNCMQFFFFRNKKY